MNDNQSFASTRVPNDHIDVPGLVFRRFRGAADYPAMAAIIEACAAADQIESVTTVDDVALQYAHLVNCDPQRDMIFAEVNGQVISYWRGTWWDEDEGPLIYTFAGYVAPDWRESGIGRTMLRWIEDRLRQVAAGHDPQRPKFFQYFAIRDDDFTARLLADEGYHIARRGQEMVRPSLDVIPDFPLPAGLEVRPVRPEHLRAIWEADVEAFRDHWGFHEPTEEEYQHFLDSKETAQPELWQIAWDMATNEVAGQVKPYINYEENEKFGRRRGYTENISVRRPWRRRGLARALIVRSLHAQREWGMTESALGVDSENTTGATRVYEDCGFQVTRRSATFRKALAAGTT